MPPNAKYNSDGDPLRLCTEGCEPTHYENCRQCFGFGLEGDHPVTAAKAELMQGRGEKAERCPQCGGTERGAADA